MQLVPSSRENLLAYVKEINIEFKKGTQKLPVLEALYGEKEPYQTIITNIIAIAEKIKKAKISYLEEEKKHEADEKAYEEEMRRREDEEKRAMKDEQARQIMAAAGMSGVRVKTKKNTVKGYMPYN